MRTDPTPPLTESALGRIVCAAAGMLEEEMESVFDGFLDLEGVTPGTPRNRAAAQAYRVVLLCRSLVQEINRYDNRQSEEDEGDEEDPLF